MYFDGALFMSREFEFCILSGFEFQNTVLLNFFFFWQPFKSIKIGLHFWTIQKIEAGWIWSTGQILAPCVHVGPSSWQILNANILKMFFLPSIARLPKTCGAFQGF